MKEFIIYRIYDNGKLVTQTTSWDTVVIWMTQKEGCDVK